MIGAIVGQLIGLFVDDWLLVIAILATLAVASVFALSVAAPGVAGLVLTIGLPVALALSVIVSARQARRKARRR